MSNHINSSTIKALILSLVIHLLVLQIFIFQVPVKDIPFKPTLIFFGSVLDKFSGITPKSISTNGDSLPIKKGDIATNNPIFNFDTNKPKSSSPDYLQKKIIKTNFLKDAGVDKLKQTDLEDIEQIHRPKPYKPLELESNDSY